MLWFQFVVDAHLWKNLEMTEENMMQETIKDIEIEKESLELARKSGDRENEMNHEAIAESSSSTLGQIDQAIQ